MTDTPEAAHDQDSSPGRVMGEESRAAFAAEIAKLRSTNPGGPLDRAFAGVGLATAVAGFVTCLVAYTQSTGFDDVRDQMESLILAVFGVGLVMFGSALYLRNSVTRFLRFWLLRVIYEQRDLVSQPSRQPHAPTPTPPNTDDGADLGTPTVSRG
jgi:hypothetical protein